MVKLPGDAPSEKSGAGGAVTTRLTVAPWTKPPLVLFLGRLTVQKNPWQFLDVAKRTLDFRPDTQFVMAGDRPMLASHRLGQRLRFFTIITQVKNRFGQRRRVPLWHEPPGYAIFDQF